MESMNKQTITVKSVNNQVKNELNYNQQQQQQQEQSNPDNLMVQLASSGIAGVAAATAILSSKTAAGNQYQFETSPAARKRHQTRLLRKIKDLIDEYAARCGQQICVICCTPLKQQTKFSNNTFKVTGTQPLETVIKNQKQTIVNELDNLLQASYMNSLKEENTSETDSRIDLPSLTIDGIPTSLDKMTQCQLRMFIPLLLKMSTGRGKPGWNKPSCKPVWWPTDLPWASIRVDPRDEESKKKNPWTNVLKTIIKNCYKYHGREDLLHKFSNIESTNQMSNETRNQHHSLLSQSPSKTSKTKQNKQKLSNSINNGVVGSTSTVVLNELKQTHTNNSTATNNNPSTTTTQTYAVLQDIRNLEQLTVLPVDISSGLVEVDNLLNNDHYMDHSNSTNELTTLKIIKQSDCTTRTNLNQANTNTNNLNHVTVITTKQDQQQQQQHQQHQNSRIVSLNDLDGSPILINTDNDNPTAFSNNRGQNVIEINVNQYQNIWGNLDNIHSNTTTTTSASSQTQSQPQQQQQQSSTNTTLRKILLTNNTNSTEQDESDEDEEVLDDDDDDDDLINNSNIIELECIASKKAKLSHYENNNNDKLNSNNTDSYVENRYKRYKKVN